MNYWTELSIQFANQRNYLDELFAVYPTISERVREFDARKWNRVEKAFNERKDHDLLEALLGLPLFPVKDSYIAYLKRDKYAIQRNPETVARICSEIYSLGLDKVFEKATEPKETNRQIGPMFRRWLQKGELGIPLRRYDEFCESDENAILDEGDASLKTFARERLGYRGEKGLDFVARMHKKYVIGEAKFLTDFGGHQNAQFEDAKNLLTDETAAATKIAILDGVLYIRGRNKMHAYLSGSGAKHTILSSLLLKEFLYQM